MIDSLSSNSLVSNSYELSLEEPSQDKRPILVLHVGLPKTATTTLQKRLFNRIEDINYLGRQFEYLSKNPHKIDLSKRSDYQIFLKSPENKNFLHRFFKDRPNQKCLKFFDLLINANKVNMISNEKICKDLFRHYDTKVRHSLEELNKKYNLKIILTLRKQQNLMPSQHLFLRHGHKLAPIPLEEGIIFTDTDNPEKKRQLENKFFSLREKDISYLITDKSFNFLHIYNNLSRLVPKEKLLVMPMEGILSDDFSYREKLFRFIAQRNPSESEKKTLSTFHLYKDNAARFPHYDEEVARFHKKGYGKRIFKIYKKSNEQLSKLLSLDLKRFGYY